MRWIRTDIPSVPLPEASFCTGPDTSSPSSLSRGHTLKGLFQTLWSLGDMTVKLVLQVISILT